MKHSIARFILGITIVVILSMAAIMTIFNIKEAEKDAYVYCQYEVSSAARVISKTYSRYSLDRLINDEKIFSMLKHDTSRLIERDNLMFIYIFTLDNDEDTLNYLYIDGTEGTEKWLDELRNNPVRKLQTPLEEAGRIVRGESDCETFEIKNKIGHVITCFVPLYGDSHKVIAIIGADINIETLTAGLLSALPFRIFVFFVIGIIGVAVLYFVMKKRVIEPADSICSAMMSFGKDNNYDTPKLDIKSTDEFGLISKSFGQMAEQIRENIDQIKEYTELQNRQKYELSVAAGIQKGLLPDEHYQDDFYKVNACMLPAKDVGGDFYDYFENGDQYILIIADVSGKGLSGAIFMANAISLVRGLAKQGLKPHELLEAVNRELERSNPNMMFVTLFFAYIDEKNGLIHYANAGHNPPYIISDGKLKKLTEAGGVPLGLFNDERYETAEEALPLEGTVFLYTDGVNEAMNSNSEFFGIERLENILRNSDGDKMIENVRKAITEFTADCDQSDDITMLTLTVKSQKLKLKAEKAEFYKLRDWILKDENIPDALKNQLRLIAEEIFINIASYAYDEAGGEVIIRKLIEDDSFILQFTDSGKPFDQTSDIADIDEYDPFTTVGGLGRFMVSELSDAWRYENIEGNNILIVVKKDNSKSLVND